MQHILTHGTLWRVLAWRSLAAGAAVLEHPAATAPASRFCVLRLSLLPPAAQRWVSASASGRTAHQPKHQSPQEQTAQPASDPPSQDDPKGQPEKADVDPLQDKSIGLVQRFKKTFKQYGKVMIPVHLATSSVWFGTFYYAAMKGVNVVPFLEMIGFPESIVGLMRDSSSGYALTAYAMFKIATPARYAVTLGGTSLSVQYLRKQGYLSTPPPVTDYLQDKMEATKERFTEKMEETKGLISEKMEETKDKLSEKLQETKDRVSEGKSFFRKKND
ncbi:uncharacterized protein C18orf19 homolog A [Xiphophorus couchianus]|uniref:DUF1279 domain-containing protein n=1 Tax=Xiphophorus couchianus TaxID=32473 RepID=A0A3B5MU36_9TELE|nr:protein FAM210A [Xiphophorus couchianus]